MCVCAYECVCGVGEYMCVLLNIWRSEGNFGEWVLSIYHVGHRDPTQASRLVSKSTDLLSHLISLRINSLEADSVEKRIRKKLGYVRYTCDFQSENNWATLTVCLS